MRLTLVIASLAGGGAERVLSTLASYWSQKDYVVTLITLASESTDFYTLNERVERVALDLKCQSPGTFSALFNNMRRLSGLRRAISTSRPDCVLSFIDQTNVLTLLACAGSGYPVVVSERVDPRHYSIGTVWEFLRRRTYPSAASIVVQTRGAAEWANRVAGRAQVVIIPNPVCVSPIAPTQLSALSNKSVVMAAGRLEPQKGFDLLLRAFRICHDRLPEWKLVIWGEGPERRNLQELMAELHLQGCVELHGIAPDIAANYGRASIFVLSSRFEGFPNVLLEAMANGLAVVSCNCPSGPSEIITHNVDGLLVPSEDIDALANSMLSLMDSRDTLCRLARAATLVRERYSIDKIAPMWDLVLARAATARVKAQHTGLGELNTDMQEVADQKSAVHADELSAGARFDFGANWARFLRRVDERQITEAEKRLSEMLERDRLDGSTFLDIGSGSGLSSLAARRLGATVISFDYDPLSVACTQEMRRRYQPDDSEWRVDAGSILDDQFVSSLPACDIVYSWGVLHHTGAMWKALEIVAQLVHNDSTLFIAIYNDQRGASRRWRRIKLIYNRLPKPLKWALLLPCFLRLWGPTVLRDTLHGRPLKTWSSYVEQRGMTPWRDVVDWVGGYPFEVARPEEIFKYFRDRGFRLTNLLTCGAGHGCNEFVFVREKQPAV